AQNNGLSAAATRNLVNFARSDPKLIELPCSALSNAHRSRSAKLLGITKVPTCQSSPLQIGGALVPNDFVDETRPHDQTSGSDRRVVSTCLRTGPRWFGDAESEQCASLEVERKSLGQRRRPLWEARQDNDRT